MRGPTLVVGPLSPPVSAGPAMGSIPVAGSTGTAFLGCACLVELDCGQELPESQFVSYIG